MRKVEVNIRIKTTPKNVIQAFTDPQKCWKIGGMLKGH